MLILGSMSPRRHEILSYFSLPFRQIASHFDEKSIAPNNNPVEYAKNLAVLKAQVLLKDYPEDIILTADTVVYTDNEILGKPESTQEMKTMLRILSGTTHSVCTAVCLHTKDAVYIDSEITRVQCYTLSDEQIQKYIDNHILEDKAGSYAIQKSGALFVERIDGCYYNVLGLPIQTTKKLLYKVGIDLWDYLKKF